MNIEFDVVERRVGNREARALAAALQVGTEIEAGRYGDLVDGDLARDRRSGARAHPVQIGISCGTDSGRIAKANVLAGGDEVEIQLLMEITGIPLKTESTTTGAGGEGFDVEVIASKEERATDFAQATRQRCIRERAILKLKMALGKRISEGPADGHVHGDQARGGEVRIETGKQLEVDVTIRSESERASAGELYGAVGGEVGSLP